MKYDESDSNPFGSVRSFQNFSESDRVIDANTDTIYPADHWLGSLQLSHYSDSGIELRNTFGVSTLNVESTIDLDGTALLPWFSVNYIDELHFSNEFSIKGTTGKHLWAAGYYYQQSSYEIESDGLGLVGTGIPFSSSAEENVNIHGIYLKNDYTLHSDFNLVAGLRVNYEERNLATTSVTALTPFTRSESSTSYLDILPSLSLVWTLNESNSIGVKAARNYRGGGVSYAPTQGVTQTYEPEYSDDIEIYYKSTPADSLQLSSSVFLSSLSDMQVPLTVPGGIPDIDVLIENIGKGKKFGFEAKAVLEPIENVVVDLSMNYTQTEFTALTLNSESLNGQSFPNAPKFTGSLVIGYLPRTGLYGSTQVSYASSTYTQATSSDLTELDGRFSVNMKLGYRLEKWDFHVYANNVLSENYALGRIDASALGAGVFSKFNEPRTLGIGFTTSW